MPQFGLSVLFALIAAIGACIAVWNGWPQTEPLSLVRQSKPVLSLSSRSERTTYEIEVSGSTHVLTATLPYSYPSFISPQVEWSFEVSDGMRHRWLCKGLILKWEMLSHEDTLLKVHEEFAQTTPYEVIPGSSYRIVKHWWVEKQQSKDSMTQKLHLYLISNDANRVLAEHQLTIVVNVVVLDGEPPKWISPPRHAPITTQNQEPLSPYLSPETLFQKSESLGTDN